MATYNYTVTVTYSSTFGQNVYVLNDGTTTTERPSLSFDVATNDVINFDVSDSSLATHPFGIGPDPANTSNAYDVNDGVVYTIGSTNYSTFSAFQSAFLSSNTNASIQWTVSQYNAATSGYFCGQHSGMGNTAVLANTFSDTTAPINGSIVIENGASVVTNRTVQCHLSATDAVGVTGWFISESNTQPNSSAFYTITSTTSYSQTVSHTITSPVGAVTLYAWFRDGVGNISQTPATATVTLNTTTITYAISGLKGPKGDTGTTGTAANITIGSVTVKAAGTQPTVVNSGNAYDVVLDFEIPKGDAGGPGEKGQTGGFVIRHKYGSYTDFLADTDPENTLGNHNYTFGIGDIAVIGGDDQAVEYGRMFLYKGANNGEPNTQNAAWQYLIDLSVQGIEGKPGDNAAITLADTHTFSDDTDAIGVTNLGTQQVAELQFTLPRGLRGPRGPEGDRGLGLKSGSDGVSVTDATVTFTYTDDSETDVTIPTGPPGPAGKSISDIELGSVAATASANAKYNLVFDFSDETSETITFDQPAAATVAVNTVTALANGATPTVVNDPLLGTATHAKLNFGIPVGDTGGPGPQGDSVDSASIADDPNDATKHQLTLTLDDTAQTELTASFSKPSDGTDGDPGVSITGVTVVDVDTIKFNLDTSPVTYTSSIDLPRGLVGPSGTIAIGTVTTGTKTATAAVSLGTGTAFNSDNQATHSVLDFTIPSGYSITDVDSVDTETIRFKLDTNPVTYTSNVTLPSGPTGSAGTVSINSFTHSDYDVAASITINLENSTFNSDGDPTHAALDISLPKARGFSNASYDPLTGRITFTSADDLGFQTGDLRGGALGGGSGGSGSGDIEGGYASSVYTSGQSVTGGFA